MSSLLCIASAQIFSQGFLIFSQWKLFCFEFILPWVEVIGRTKQELVVDRSLCFTAHGTGRCLAATSLTGHTEMRRHWPRFNPVTQIVTIVTQIVMLGVSLERDSSLSQCSALSWMKLRLPIIMMSIRHKQSMLRMTIMATLLMHLWP